MSKMKLIAGLAACLAVLASQAALRAEQQMPDPDLSGSGLEGEWWATPNVTLEYQPGSLCAAVPGGTVEPWDAIIGINGMQLSSGEGYRLGVSVSGDPEGRVRALAQEGVSPWRPEGELVRSLSPERQDAMVLFQAGSTRENAQVVFQLGGAEEPWRFCLHSVSLTSGSSFLPEVDGNFDTPIRSNQVVYLRDGPKRATLVRSETEPVVWSLISASGNEVATGRTRAEGWDAASGLNTHLIDFSDFDGTGDSFVLKVESAESHPFSIADGKYSGLYADALAYFYKVRSGIDIGAEFGGEEYARPAGHIGKRPNRGDTSVGCVDTRTARKVYGEAWSCDYRLDVSGGWYDAGDFGKYVVNGGIATAQLLSTYERALHHSGGGSAALSEAARRIPETGNGVPDILDEARWELDFLLSMVVPEGELFAGMAHHKMHGNTWTTGAIMPHRDRAERVLHRPSTAATLNLAAAAAQGARLFSKFDPEYAEKLIDAAIRAYEAAEAHPDLFAPATNGTYGGGDYQDDQVSDEFYWAASELFIATGDQAWLDRLKASPHWDGTVFAPDGFNWRSTAALGRLHLASLPSKLGKADLERIRDSVIDATEGYIRTQNGEAFGVMYNPPQGFGWGSNHSMIQNMIVVATAYDITGDRRYLQAVRESMDYLLGRNALGISYVTGYGSYFAERQYSNIFSHATDPSFPRPPKGVMAGGPNSQPADDFAISVLAGCAPQACYVDDARSYSTNEIAINWNAPLVWIAAFLADAD
ncbi:glycoside hydrolase family 9 protein [Hoeflea sp.]|uniref:glycoside hydrolase family 9 protein n=1 Tax=Hoeflea sp. TaxID=1940281 RepID=UPI003BB20DE4